MAKCRKRRVPAAAENKRLERQRTDLVAVLRKQCRLVDVLKRQRLHLEAAQLLGFTREEEVHGAVPQSPARAGKGAGPARTTM